MENDRNKTYEIKRKNLKWKIIGTREAARQQVPAFSRFSLRMQIIQVTQKIYSVKLNWKQFCRECLYGYPQSIEG